MITIVDYGMGNLASIKNMLRKLGEDSIISNDPKDIEAASSLILPGVGAFDYGMKNMKRLNLIQVLESKVLGERVPMLGICLGMQLLTKKSEEGSEDGLGWVNAVTVKFEQDSIGKSLKVPHMGWNAIKMKNSPLFADLEDKSRFYFVHSYYVKTTHEENIAATTTYGQEFTSAINDDNIYGVQFHPEKSHRYGMQLLRNFIGISTSAS